MHISSVSSEWLLEDVTVYTGPTNPYRMSSIKSRQFASLVAGVSYKANMSSE